MSGATARHAVTLSLALGSELALLGALLFAPDTLAPPVHWLALHALASVVAAAAVTDLATEVAGENARPGGRGSLFLLCLTWSSSIPFVGALGAACALVGGFHVSSARHRGPLPWRLTPLAELPFSAPSARPAGGRDVHGFAEQLARAGDGEDLYHKVLAAGRMRPSLSVPILKAAVAHPDERIRLTAYQSLDRQITHLNREIQALEARAAAAPGLDPAGLWSRVTGNYCELLVLEQDEPVARGQLLDKAFEAASRAVSGDGDDRGAYLVLGRVLLARGEPEAAAVALEHTLERGMAREKIVPYLAETAFLRRDFARVSALLDSIDAAFKRHPPLRQLASYWT